MAYLIEKVDVWAGTIEDRPGGLGEKLALLTEAAANLEFLIARRQPEKPGTGVVFLAPLKGPKQLAAARKAGLNKAQTLCSLRMSGPDKPGLGSRITAELTAADINLRGISAASIARKCIVYFAFDTQADAAKAARVLKKAFA
ncbi:MAG: amino acid-binding protein [bacterium]|nr:amino acid-binding protein [bacterium]